MRRRRTRARAPTLVLTLALVLPGLLAACTSPTEQPASTITPPTARATAPSPGTPTTPDLETAQSTPVEDSVYPRAGDPGVDTLLYDLDLRWQPERRRLSGTATITLRATDDAESFQLDLGRPLTVQDLTLDGEETAFSHRGTVLVVEASVRTDERHELVVRYAGRPKPVPAPTTRGDLSTVGFTVTESGEAWTMQEPFGAFTWYPVNDQPSDKALYDVTVHVPSPWTGISNGRLVEQEEVDGVTTTRWQLDEPAASYLVTLAIGDYAHDVTTSESGVRVDSWYPRGLPAAASDLAEGAPAIDWIEQWLGPYPFSSAGLVLTDSESAMETQTMITLGNTDYTRSPAVVVHEMVHQWYGDEVSPADWRDVWMNEGMTMYLQAMWEATAGGGAPLEATLTGWRRADRSLRAEYGPPGDYDPRRFGGSNIYYIPAVMWHELRDAVGDDVFWETARGWLAERRIGSATREQLYDYWEQQTGLELSDFFDAWISGETTPPPGMLEEQ